jgi:hypothetical protein
MAHSGLNKQYLNRDKNTAAHMRMHHNQTHIARTLVMVAVSVARRAASSPVPSGDPDSTLHSPQTRCSQRSIPCTPVLRVTQKKRGQMSQRRKEKRKKMQLKILIAVETAAVLGFQTGRTNLIR